MPTWLEAEEAHGVMSPPALQGTLQSQSQAYSLSAFFRLYLATVSKKYFRTFFLIQLNVFFHFSTTVLQGIWRKCWLLTLQRPHYLLKVALDGVCFININAYDEDIRCDLNAWDGHALRWLKTIDKVLHHVCDVRLLFKTKSPPLITHSSTPETGEADFSLDSSFFNRVGGERERETPRR